MIDEFLEDAIKAAQRDLALAQLEKIAGIKLTDRRRECRHRMQAFRRKITTIKAAQHYREHGKWVGGPTVPAKVRAAIRGCSGSSMAVLVLEVAKAAGWSDLVWK